MTTSDAQYVELWGRILLHNKLMTQAEWVEIQIAYGKKAGKVPIEQILLKKSKLSPQQLGIVAGKIQKVLKNHDQDHDVARPTDAAPEPAAEQPDEPQVVEADDDDDGVVFEAEAIIADDDDDDAVEFDDSPITSSTDDGVAVAQAVDDDDDDDEEVFEITTSDYDSVTTAEAADDVVRDSDDDTDEPAVIDDEGEPLLDDDDVIDRGAEVDWASGSGGSAATFDEAEAHRQAGEIEQIDLDGDDDEYEGKDLDERLSKLSKPETLKDDSPPAKAAKPAPTIFSDDEDEAHARIPCDVAPMDFDETAVKLIQQAVKNKASDVHLASGSPPFMRLHGKLVFFKMDPLTPEQTRRMLLGFMDDRQQQTYLRTLDLDFSLEDKMLGRFRVNALQQFRGPSIIFRIIPSDVPSLKSLGLPEAIGKFTQYTQGLVLVTGSAGCGKSTTAAALINMVNHDRRDHIITVEDPVEFIHTPDLCNITQRQVPRDTESFATALRAALREDPDVIMIGEMRDLETVSLAIRAAETGHLVIGTLQTRSATRTIDRIIDVFPEDQQPQIRSMLSESLRGVVSQQLIPRADGNGRVVALEVLTVTGAVSNLIRDNKTFQLVSLMQTGAKAGMVIMQDSVDKLLEKKLITKEEALKAVTF